MLQIAQIIIKRRKERDLTLEKVMQAIKIRLPYLQSIEKVHMGQICWVGEVYVRGFVKRYADFLGLDAVVLMAPYLVVRISGGRGEPGHQHAALFRRESACSFCGSGSIGIFIVVFIKLIQKERTAPLKSIATVTSSTATAVNVWLQRLRRRRTSRTRGVAKTCAASFFTLSIVAARDRLGQNI